MVKTYEGNPQQLFDDVVNHLRKQGCKASGKNLYGDISTCLYRGDNGTKCAIGGIIPDELYNPILENRTCHSIMYPTDLSDDKKPLCLQVGNLIGLSNESLADRLQVIHDADNVEDWEEGFKKVADEYHLVYTPR